MAKATIHERGNGFPHPGDYVPGDDGELYRLIAYDGPIHTGSAGEANYVYADVELVDWSDCPDGDEYEALVSLEDE